MTALLLETLVLDAWPPRERATLHGWTMLADGGVTGRVNAVSPLAFDGAPLEPAIDEAAAWLTARGIRPCFKIADGACAPPQLVASLQARGWRPHTETLVMTASVDDALVRLGAPAHTVTLTPDFAPQVDAVLRETVTDPAEYAERSGIARRTPAPRRFAVLERDGVAAAIGLSVVTGDWAVVGLMRTHPGHRRQGLAHAVVTTLLRWARDAGAERAYLQVEAANAPAIALYRQAGFADAYAYRYWRPEQAPREEPGE